MPVSLRLEDTLKSFGIQAGLHRIVSADWMVHKFQAKDGKEYEPFVCLAIGYLPIDAKGNAIGEAEIDYSLKVGPKYGETIDKAKFAPAAVPNQPLPLRLGSKGPFLEPVGDQKQLSDKSKVILYLAQLYKCGFKVEKLVDANFNVGLLVGTEGDIYELVSENDGTDESGNKMKPTKIPAFKSVSKFGYEVQGMAASAPAQVVNGVAGASTPAPAGNVNDLAVTVLATIIKNSKEKGNKAMAKADVVKLVFATTAKMSPRPSSTERDAVKDLLNNDSFYESDAVLNHAILSGDQVEFA